MSTTTTVTAERVTLARIILGAGHRQRQANKALEKAVEIRQEAAEIASKAAEVAAASAACAALCGAYEAMFGVVASTIELERVIEQASR